MKLHQFTFGVILAIAATIGIQSTALSQGRFKNPTQPHLSEIGTIESIPTGMASPQQFRNPTRPHLSEIGTSKLTTVETTQSQTSQPQISQLRLRNGQTFFSNPPRLARINASQKQSHVPSTYEVTLRVPVDAGQPLKAVKIVQERNLETVKFDLNRSKAFAGERYAAGPEIPLASVGGTSTPGEAMVVFAQPVQPGSTVTIAFKTNANPEAGGIYEFGITAFPDGENGLGQFLGLGRISFNNSSS